MTFSVLFVEFSSASQVHTTCFSLSCDGFCLFEKGVAWFNHDCFTARGKWTGIVPPSLKFKLNCLFQVVTFECTRADKKIMLFKTELINIMFL